MSAPVMPFPRRFTVRASTTEEAARFSGRRRAGDQAVTIIDHLDDEVAWVVAASDVVIEDTDQCAWFLFREQAS